MGVFREMDPTGFSMWERKGPGKKGPGLPEIIRSARKEIKQI